MAETDNAAATGTTGIDAADWKPETIEEGTGVPLDGDGLPVSHRLRAERLARDGKGSDPGGVITDDLIADTAKRVANEDKAADAAKAAELKANPPVRANMRVDDLTSIATAEGVDMSAATTNAERVDAIIASRTLRGITVDAAAEGEPN